MYLTKMEARAKWCWRSYGIHDPDHVSVSSCDASFCMAWRWGDQALIFPASGHQVCVRENAAGVKEDWPIDQRRGFCGLAGKPEVE